MHVSLSGQNRSGAYTIKISDVWVNELSELCDVLDVGMNFIDKRTTNLKVTPNFRLFSIELSDVLDEINDYYEEEVGVK
jgi:hypothetical protein